MTRSTVQPDTLRVWKIDPTDAGFQVHISASWNAEQITVGEDMGSRQEWQYDDIRFVVPYEGPRDGVTAWLEAQEARLVVVAKTLWEVKRNKPALTSDEAKALVDFSTQERIRSALHPLAGQGEEIGILRDQLAQWGNELGLTFTPGFARLNEIAITAIEEGGVKKVAI